MAICLLALLESSWFAPRYLPPAESESHKMTLPKVKLPLVTPVIRRRIMAKMRNIPAEVCIETTSKCNLACIMCPRENMRRLQMEMDFELYKKIVDQCVELGVKCIKPHNFGEPLMASAFADHIKYIRQRSKTIKILLVTNGQLLTGRTADLLIEEKVDAVNLSIDGASQESYEKIRRNGKYERVVANAKQLIRKKRSAGAELPLVTVGLVKMEQSEEEIRKFHEMWAGLANGVSVTRYSTRAGTLPGSESADRKKRTPCFRLWKQMVVCSDGKVALCCADWDCSIELGDLNTTPLEDVWRGEKINALRHLHMSRRAETISTCSNCDPDSWDSKPIWWY